jgi:hypothetical protein
MMVATMTQFRAAAFMARLLFLVELSADCSAQRGIC